MEGIEAQTCGRCGRPYRPESDDLGICCICLRDVAYHRVYGPKWRAIVLAQNASPGTQGTDAIQASPAGRLPGSTSGA